MPFRQATPSSSLAAALAAPSSESASGDVSTSGVQAAQAQSAELHAILAALEGDAAVAVPHQNEMEARFGLSFSGVQAHVGPHARQALDGLGAEALATAGHVAFRTDQPSRGLVAHELAHVVQQARTAGGPRPQVGGADDAHERLADRAARQTLAGGPVDVAALSGGGAAPAAVQLKKKLPTDIEKVYEAHPHNYQADESKNTPSDELQKSLGWDPAQYSNTCAIRMSVMFNRLGGDYLITPAKAAAAGIKKGRLAYSKSTKFWIILSAKEMWTYMTAWYGAPNQVFPAKGRYKDEDAFNAAWASEIQPFVASHQGIVAFDKIFGYSGTGHMDIFQGESLSDAPEFYPCESLKLWLIAPA